MNKLADIIKLKRKQKGWTQQQLGEKIGMQGETAKQYISKLERAALPGMNIVRMENLLANLDCSITFIDRTKI